MSLYPKFRDVHLWIGLILLIPLGAIAATGVMLNHERVLGLKPKYEKKEKGEKETEHAEQDGENEHKLEKMHRREKQAATATLVSKPNAWQQHSKQLDLALAEGAKLWGDANLERMELKDEHGYGLVVKLKVQRDMLTGYSGPDEIVWSVSEQAIIERKGDPKDGIAWNKVVHDLHTGQIFSREYGFFWSDVSGIAMLLLGFTGLVLYVIPLLKKAGKKKAAVAKTASGKPTGSPALNPALLAKKARAAKQSAEPQPATAEATTPQPAAELTLS